MDTETKAKILFIQSYEWINEIDLKGYFPENPETENYKSAKRRALFQAGQYKSKEVYFYILNNF